MVRHIFFTIVFISYLSTVFASQCQNSDEKFIKVDSEQIGYSMYNETVYTNKLQKCDLYDLDCDLFTGGEWELKNKSSNNFNVIGQALCLDSQEFDSDNNQTGAYCHCKIKELDNYAISADWVNVKHYQNNIFDENKKYSSEYDKKNEQKRINAQNTQDCMNNCSQTCQSSLSRLIKAVHGYYICADALYKTTEVMCVVDKQLIKAKTILVFDDVAEIRTKNNSIVFTKGEDDIFIGTYDYSPVYLKVKNNKIYVGTNTYSMEECL